MWYSPCKQYGLQGQITSAMLSVSGGNSNNINIMYSLYLYVYLYVSYDLWNEKPKNQISFTTLLILHNFIRPP